MKRIPLLISLFLLTTQTFSQNTFPNTGNSGIGTVNPQASLDIVKSYDAGQTKALKMFYSGSWGYQSYAKDFRFLDIESSEEGKILQLNAYGMGLGYNPPGYASPDKLYINGNVGVGTTTPQSKLHIYQNAADQSGLVIQGTTINADGAQHYVALTLDGDYGNATGNNSQIRSYSNLYWSWGSRLAFFTTSSAKANTLLERMRIDAEGNIGIGTTDPKGYRLAVNGNIRAKEIKVETANWPDYVFSNSYPLPTLQETEKHIKEKGHLPGIPTAEEVNAHGIALGEMNAKLLQKIEELTLHIIELSKTVQKQQTQIDNQNRK